jgi:hypothetical protein
VTRPGRNDRKNPNQAAPKHDNAGSGPLITGRNAGRSWPHHGCSSGNQGKLALDIITYQSINEFDGRYFTGRLVEMADDQPAQTPTE